MHLFDGVDQVGQTFECKVFALHRHDHAMRCTQAIEGEHGQGWWAIDQHKIVVSIDHRQGVFQALVPSFQLHQLNLSPRQFAVGPQNVIPTLFGADARLRHTGGLQQDVVDTELQLALVNARAHGRIALRIQVHQQHTLTDFGQTCSQVDSGGGLADATFLVGYAENFGHGAPRYAMPEVYLPSAARLGLNSAMCVSVW